MVDFLFAPIELFRYLLRFQSYEAKCVQLSCFHTEIDLFALKVYMDRVATINVVKPGDIENMDVCVELLFLTVLCAEIVLYFRFGRPPYLFLV